MQLFKTKYNELSEQLLFDKMSQGNSKAFDELYSRYAQMLIRYFYRMIRRDKEKAEDFVHDIFTKLIQKPELFDSSRSFKTWIFSVANNMCKNEYKKLEVRKNIHSADDSWLSVQDDQTNVFHEVHDQLFKEAYDSAIEQLELKHKEVFEMRHMDGLAIKEIAEILQINEGTIKSRLFYATKHLANHLKEFNPLIEV